MRPREQTSIATSLEKAAAPTLERIRRERKEAPPQLRPLLAYVEEHLFDPDLDVGRLKRACGVRDNSVSISFHQALTLPPYAYIEDCRMEIACRLLRDSELKVWQIAQRLGYSTLQIFSRAFDRWSGIRPSVYRRRCRAAESSPTESDAPLPIRLETLRKALRGELSNPEADELSCRFAELYPESFCSPPAPLVADDSGPSADGGSSGEERHPRRSETSGGVGTLSRSPSGSPRSAGAALVAGACPLKTAADPGRPYGCDSELRESGPARVVFTNASSTFDTFDDVGRSGE